MKRKEKGLASQKHILDTVVYFDHIEELGGPKHFYSIQKKRDKNPTVVCFPLEGAI